MLRRLSAGNNRNRGLVPNDSLRISLILAFTIWILYHLIYTYENNTIVDSYMQVKVRQKYKMEEESALDFSRDPATATRNVVEFEKEERKIADSMHEDRGNSEDVVNENDIEEGDREKRIKEHEARERSFKDDDASSAVLHDNQIPEIKEELSRLTSELATYSANQNMTNDDNDFDFILGNGTINETDVQKNISHLGSYSEKPDEIEDVHNNENELLVNLNETYIHGEDATDKQNRVQN